ncbi:type I-C CRISPR-associated endonuclease Cas1c [Thiothrix lacustris]|uniref:type I-C CRISPR-associated endonuclease Cas1c n=1 Tax=Thiothrix lacustris TaxID=525917 RepID=UPI0027E451DA|nr:type I-C CRISPR-associated endonuclease Cas1c [Thiothrix lacustris]WMP16941.1 type I-C CRISPR-associated endonuclease Cas1c [Thiothrix lacustris]
MKQLLNTLYVSTEGAYLRLEGETLVVMVDQTKKGQVPLHHLGAIVCLGRVSMSPALMARNMEDGRSIVWLNEHGWFQARVEGPVNGNILLRQAQFRAADKVDIALEISKAFIAGKLRNSRNVLLRSARDSKDEEAKAQLVRAAKSLGINLRNLAHAESAASVLGLEGDAARVYFEQFNTMIKPQMREEFEYKGRSRRPPKDAVNALISFLYALLLNDCRSALETVGLDPQLGFFHVVRPGRPALALDLLEEFRAVLGDRLALTLINRGQLRQKDFDFRPGGAVMLNDTGRKTVIVAYQERKKETLQHPVLETQVEIGLLPLLQARMLARYLRGDVEAYIPFFNK